MIQANSPKCMIKSGARPQNMFVDDTAIFSAFRMKR